MWTKENALSFDNDPAYYRGFADAGQTPVIKIEGKGENIEQLASEVYDIKFCFRNVCQ